jgi:hypothetical protein
MKLPITIKISEDDIYALVGRKALDILGLCGKPYRTTTTLKFNRYTEQRFSAEVTINEAKNE